MTSDLRSAKPATPVTVAANAAVGAALNFADDKDFHRASRGLLRQLDPPTIVDGNGTVVWDLEKFAFLAGDAPPEATMS